jgi:pimeloyl-ACP methyl ester carboxylesterase
VLDLEQVGLIGHDWGGWLGFLLALDRPERLHGLLALGILHPFQAPTPAKLLQAWRGSYQLLLAAPLLPELVMRSSPQFVAGMIRSGSVRDEAMGPQVARLYGEVLRDPARARASVQLYRTFVTHEVRQLGPYQRRRLHVPTHLIVGSNDFLTTKALLDGWQGHADDMLVETIPGAGHFLPEEAPGHVARAARKLFAAA